MEMNSSAAVLARCSVDEGPYLNAFVLHYFSLNFNKIYLVNTSISPNYIYENIEPRYRPAIEVLNFLSNVPKWQDKLFQWVGRYLCEDWILNVDIDEFLCIPESCICTYLSKIDPTIEKIHFKWLLCVSDCYVPESLAEMNCLPIHLSSQFKSMVKNVAIVKIGVHDTRIKNPERFIDEPIGATSGFVMHYACRGFLDLINRIIDRNYENVKSGKAQETTLKNMFYKPHKNPLEFPFRFNQYRVIRSLPTTIVPSSRLPNDHRLATNNDLLRSIVKKKLMLLKMGSRFFSIHGDLESAIEDRIGLMEILLDNKIPISFGLQYIRGNMSLTNTTRMYIEHLKTANLST